MRQPPRLVFLSLLALLTGVTGGCASRASADSDQVLTDIYTSVALTLSAASTPTSPTATVTSSPTPAPTFTPYPSPWGTSTAAAGYRTYTGGCNKASFVRDVTITDGAELAPGETFTKTWEFLNEGSCSWGTGYAVAFVGGSRMDGSTETIGKTVAVGASGDVSVELTAPEDEGTYTGYWSLADAGGNPFGEQVYVQIVVTGDAATNTPTPTLEPTATRTPTLKPTATPTATSQATATPTPTSQATATASPTPQVIGATATDTLTAATSSGATQPAETPVWTPTPTSEISSASTQEG